MMYQIIVDNGELVGYVIDAGNRGQIYNSYECDRGGGVFPLPLVVYPLTNCAIRHMPFSGA